MGLHTLLYRNAAVAISASFASLPIIPFSADNVSNNQWLPNFDAKLVLATGFGATLSALRVQTPLLLQTASMWLKPWNIGIVPVTNYNIADLTDYPIVFNRMENVNVQTSNSSGAATDDQWVVLWFSDGIVEKPSGKDICIRLTGTTTQTANAWTRCTLTPDESLPNKRFAIMSFEVVSTTGICARLDIPGWAPGGKQMHPGTVPLPTIGLRQPYPLYESPFGKIGEFDNQTIPGLEIFSKAADTAQTVWMWLRQIN
jgi:hypothetical protein